MKADKLLKEMGGISDRYTEEADNAPAPVKRPVKPARIAVIASAAAALALIAAAVFIWMRVSRGNTPSEMPTQTAQTSEPVSTALPDPTEKPAPLPNELLAEELAVSVPVSEGVKAETAYSFEGEHDETEKTLLKYYLARGTDGDALLERAKEYIVSKTHSVSENHEGYLTMEGVKLLVEVVFYRDGEDEGEVVFSATVQEILEMWKAGEARKDSELCELIRERIETAGAKVKYIDVRDVRSNRYDENSRVIRAAYVELEEAFDRDSWEGRVFNWLLAQMAKTSPDLQGRIERIVFAGDEAFDVRIPTPFEDLAVPEPVSEPGGLVEDLRVIFRDTPWQISWESNDKGYPCLTFTALYEDVKETANVKSMHQLAEEAAASEPAKKAGVRTVHIMIYNNKNGIAAEALLDGESEASPAFRFMLPQP